MSDYDFLLKIVGVGDTGVGKSCILLRYTNNTFSESFISTIGVDFSIKTLPHANKTYKLQIWDTAGQERFRTITSAYYRGCAAVPIVYDITDPESFASVRNWFQEVNRYAPQGVILVLVGNKSDLESQRKVSTSDGQELADSLGIPYFFETSAKEDINISKIYESIVEAHWAKQQQTIEAVPEPITPYGSEPEKSGGIGGPTLRIRKFDDLFRGSVLENVTQLLKEVAEIQSGEANKELQSLNEMLADKPNGFKVGVSVGEFFPQCGLYVKQKLGSEAAAIVNDVGLGGQSLALVIAFKVADSVDTFELGEISGSIKNVFDLVISKLSEPGLDKKLHYKAKVLTEADGSRVLRISLELVDAELFDALQKVLAFIELIKFDASIEFSEKPVHHPTEEFFKFRATAEVQWKRSVLVLGQHLLHRFFHPPGRGPANWRCRQYNFIALLARSNVFLEFDDVQEFWETAVQVGPEHRMKRVGWHSLSRTAEEELGRIPDLPLADTYDKVVKSLVGIHSAHVVLSGQQVLEVRAENFDIFTLLPTMQEVKDAKAGK